MKRKYSFESAARVHVKAGGEERRDHKDQTEHKNKHVEIAVLEVERGEGDIKVDETNHGGDQQALKDGAELAFRPSLLFVFHSSSFKI